MTGARRSRWSAALIASFGGSPQHGGNGDGMPTEGGEATEIPEIKSPLDED